MKYKLKFFWFWLVGAKMFYVHYNDGKKTYLMHYGTCKDYAEIFGGKVKLHLNQ